MGAHCDALECTIRHLQSIAVRIRDTKHREGTSLVSQALHPALDAVLAHMKGPAGSVDAQAIIERIEHQANEAQRLAQPSQWRVFRFGKVRSWFAQI